jgi:drug/metabolite transporter (DMT)-like permease
LIKRGLFTPDHTALFTGTQVGALRIVVAALFLSPIAVRRLGLLKNGKLKYFLTIGLFGNAIPAFLFATAQTKIPSALAGMLNAMVPIFSLLIAVFVFHVKVRRWQVVGIVAGLFASFGLVAGSGQLAGADIQYGYALLVVLATFCYAVSLNTMKQFLQNEPAVAITSLALLLVSPIGFGILFSTDFVFKMNHMPGAWYGFGAIAVLAILGTAIALVLFNKLVQDTNTLFASSVTYLIPIVAIGWGLSDGETVSLIQIICALVMLAGILLINRK